MTQNMLAIHTFVQQNTTTVSISYILSDLNILCVSLVILIRISSKYLNISQVGILQTGVG